MDFDLFGMDVLGMDGFSLEDMPYDVVCVGKVKNGEAFEGEAAWQSVILSPFGYEVCLADLSDSEEEGQWLKEQAKAYGVYVTKDVLKEAARCKVLAISGLFENELASRLDLKNILQEAKKNNTLVCVDPGKIMDKEKDREVLKSLAPFIDYLLPNEEEAAALTDGEILPDMADAFLEMGIGDVIITTGMNGCFVRGEGSRFAMGAVWGKTVDLTGIGANFMAGFVHGLFQDWQMKTRCEFATGCASVSAGYQGPIEGARDRKEAVKKVLNNPYL